MGPVGQPPGVSYTAAAESISWLSQFCAQSMQTPDFSEAFSFALKTKHFFFKMESHSVAQAGVQQRDLDSCNLRLLQPPPPGFK